jgi:flagellar basal-body rod protein FlgB
MVSEIGVQMERYLDLLSSRQKLVAGNIANVDTPGYLTRDIDFQFEYLASLSGDGQGSPHVVEAEGLTAKLDGNNVSVDREARLLAENALRFQLVSGLMRNEIRELRMAIGEGRNG